MPYASEDPTLMDNLLYKRIDLPGERDGEPLVTALLTGSSSQGFEKLAYAARYHPEVETFIRQLKPDKAKLYVLVNALGAFEAYGCNLNGDSFPEAELLRGGGYGYRTYYQAGVYRDHKNHRRGGIPFGRVALAVYNDRMKRVELILELDRAKAKSQGHQDLIDKLDAGEHPPVSMGVLVPYDVCSVCGCQAKKSVDRCACVTGNLRGIDPRTGQQVSMINVFLRFHDISFVVVPADYQGFAVEKIASRMRSKAPPPVRRHSPTTRACAQKLAEMMKRIPALAEKVDSRTTPTLELPGLSALAKQPLLDVVGGTAQAGVVLKPIEFQTIVLKIVGEPHKADALYREGRCFGAVPGYDASPMPNPHADYSVIKRLIASLLPQRSVLEQDLADGSLHGLPGAGSMRIIRVTKDPILEKVASAYQGYRLLLLENALTLLPATQPVSLEAALLGFAKQASGPAVGEHTIAALYGADMPPTGMERGAHLYDRAKARATASLCRSVYEDGLL